MKTKLQKEVDAFNEKYPVGSTVVLITDENEAHITKVRGAAFILGNHTAVAFFENIVGCYDISKVV